MTSQTNQLQVYSAGAVAPPLQKAIDVFENKFEIRCKLTVGKPSNLLAAIAVSKQGDVISCGAEYVLDEAEDRGLVVKGSRRSMGFRRSVIIVPIGNPAKITSLQDLCRENVRIGIAVDGCLKGVWDDIASKAGLTDQIRRNITHHADACGSLMGLIHQDKVDAIFGWNAFQSVWPDTCEVIELPSDLQVFRSTVVAMVSYTGDAKLSQKFIDFLTSDEVRKIYSDYGWVHKQQEI
ncbi:MAG: substrate-binding domain-containing protein [Candidatus Bathyarchaeota archaeon]|nr:substrate-binding domain-containing protein [Candidatus Bathyarchaeota archaeon]